MSRFVLTINNLWNEDDIENIIKNNSYDFRINSARMGSNEAIRYSKAIKSLAAKHGANPQLFIDLPGSKARVWSPRGIKVEMTANTLFEIYLVTEPKYTSRVQITGREIFDAIREGDRLQVRRVNYDEMFLTVLKKYNDKIYVYAETNVIIGWGYQIINKNNYCILKKITSYDRAYIKDIGKISPDIIGLSFTDCTDIICDLRKQLSAIIQHRIKVFAKVETKYAVEQIQDLTDIADGVIIGRDDLLAWYTQTEVNELVKTVVQLCKEKNIPVVPASNYFLSLGHSKEMTKEEYGTLMSLLAIKPEYVYVNETNKNPDWKIFSNTINLLLKQAEGK